MNTKDSKSHTQNWFLRGEILLLAKFETIVHSCVQTIIFHLYTHMNPADHFYQLFCAAVLSLASFSLKPAAKPLNNNLYTLIRV